MSPSPKAWHLEVRITDFSDMIIKSFKFRITACVTRKRSLAAKPIADNGDRRQILEIARSLTNNSTIKTKNVSQLHLPIFHNLFVLKRKYS
jgi:hypothetical protein